MLIQNRPKVARDFEREEVSSVRVSRQSGSGRASGCQKLSVSFRPSPAIVILALISRKLTL